MISDAAKLEPTDDALAIAECPAADTHGTPFRYCGVCGWMEESKPLTVCATCESTNELAQGIRTDMNQVMQLLGLIHGEITPTLTALQNSPIFKMLGVKSND